MTRPQYPIYLLLVALLVGCDHVYIIDVSVSGEDNQPVSGASVYSLHEKEDTEQISPKLTNDSGTVTFSEVGGSSIKRKIVVMKEGYRTHERKKTFQPGDSQLNVVLEKGFNE